ncbi:MAG TPA: RNB domain-containing ribonuclease [Actinocrinis sp.]|nr:RNB domain-containing ribonuclease [Actinocrinis sp.]
MPRRVLVIDSKEAPDVLRTALRDGFAAIRAEFELPAHFPAEVQAEADAAADPARALPAGAADRRDLPLVTLDPPGAMDLDQAMAIERRGTGYRVWYAIADVAHFVAPGSALDREARRRGETIYLPDGRVPLHPPVLSEGAASLLPDADRPAVLWRMDLDSGGDLGEIEVVRALVRSRARLDYPAMARALDQDTAPDAINMLREVGPLLMAREVTRGGISLHTPTQEISADGGPDLAGWRLEYRAGLAIEDWNAQISLLTGMAAARLMLAAGTGILRTLPEADPGTVGRLHRAARALRVRWPEGETYASLIRRMDPAKPRQAAFLTEATALLRGAGYTSFHGARPPYVRHAALATEYAHVTAPLRRLVDRFGSEVCLAVSAGRPVPEWVCQALPGLPAEMAEGERRAKAVERASIDLAEVVILRDRIGEEFDGVVLDLNDRIDWDRNGKPDAGVVMLHEPAVIGRIDGHDLPQGAQVRVRLVSAQLETRRVMFDWVDATVYPEGTVIKGDVIRTDGARPEPGPEGTGPGGPAPEPAAAPGGAAESTPTGTNGTRRSRALKHAAQKNKARGQAPGDDGTTGVTDIDPGTGTETSTETDPGTDDGTAEGERR